jgi:dTDP-glucose 4,6-dehydratase
MSCKVARIIAQIGPHLALDKQFAAGNFILNAMKGERFVIKGDGTPLRSYMYGTDLFVWLIRILINGVAGRAYNVGSNYAISISDLANLIAKAAGIVNPKLDIREKPSAQKHLERYVPDISRAENELELNVTVGLEDAIERTLHWFRLYESSH